MSVDWFRGIRKPLYPPARFPVGWISWFCVFFREMILVVFPQNCHWGFGPPTHDIPWYPVISHDIPWCQMMKVHPLPRITLRKLGSVYSSHIMRWIKSRISRYGMIKWDDLGRNHPSPRPDPGAWWTSLAAVGDRLGSKLTWERKGTKRCGSRWQFLPLSSGKQT